MQRLTKNITESQHLLCQQRNKPSTLEARNCSSTLAVNRSRARLTTNKYFSIENNLSEGHPSGQNRLPTPVAYPERSEERAKPNYLSMSAKERMILYSSDQDVPHFASENPSVKSHFSDQVDSHPLTEIDDYDIDDNLSSIVLSIKKQNDNLMSRIQSKRKEKIDLASTMNTNAKSRVLGVPLRDFQTPEVSKFRTKVIESDFISPDERRVFRHDDENNHYEEHAKSSHVDTEEVEFEREDASEADHKLNISGTHKKSELSSAYDAPPEDKGVTSEECTLLKS